MTADAAAPTPVRAHTTAEKLAELREKLELAKDPGDEKAKSRRDRKGIPSARARIHALLDPGGAAPESMGSPRSGRRQPLIA